MAMEAEGGPRVTSLRESLQRHLGRGADPQVQHAAFAYVVYWTKTVGGWTPERRAATLRAVQGIAARQDFVPTIYQRRYRLAEVDASAHAGASLIALRQVLETMQSE
jgi:hypothetical protein